MVSLQSFFRVELFLLHAQVGAVGVDPVGLGERRQPAKRDQSVRA